MAARVSNKVGLDADGQNFLLMHAMGPNVAGGDRRRRSPPGLSAQVRAGDVGQPVPAAGMSAAGISHKETVMNETIACCPENRTSTREAVVDAMLTSGDEIAQLQPALNLLTPPLNVAPGEALLASCYEAGADRDTGDASAFPAAVVHPAAPSLQRSGLLCMAPGAQRPASSADAQPAVRRGGAVRPRASRRRRRGGQRILYRAQHFPARLPASAAG